MATRGRARYRPVSSSIIPRQAAAPALTPPASKPVAVAPAAAAVHVVNKGDTLLSISRRNHVPVAELAKANNLDQSARLSLGMKLKVPGAKTAVARRCFGSRGCCRACRSCAEDGGNGTAAKRAMVQPTANVEVPAAAPEAPPSSRAKRPARCRPSAGRCAAR